MNRRGRGYDGEVTSLSSTEGGLVRGLCRDGGEWSGVGDEITNVLLV